jgi:proline iminopeptidase
MTYINLTDTRLHVAIHGPEPAPALLYIHGGPGQGAYDFVHFQGDRLSKRLRLIAPDQRGVLFSDPLPVNATVSEPDLVSDFEALREALGIERWAILGHSYGGRLALRYAVSHPDTVRAIVFENVAWDWSLAIGTLLEAMLPVLREVADAEVVNRATRLLASDRTGLEAWKECRALVGELGSRRQEVYDHGSPIHLPTEDLEPTAHQHTGRFVDALDASPSFMESLLPLLKRITQPALLIKGVSDPATSKTEIERFRTDVPRGTVEFFEHSGHFAQYEEAEKYADLVTRFVLEP